MTQITFRYQSRCGVLFNVSPSLVDSISQLIDSVTLEIRKHRDAQRLIGYLSVPISSRGGGDFLTNTAMVSAIAKNVQEQFGSELWILNPAAYNPMAFT